MKDSPPQSAITFKKALDTAYLLHKRGDLQAAETIYRELLRQLPVLADGWHLLGMLLCQSQRPQEGIEALERAVELAPDKSLFHAELGRVLRLIGKHEVALETLERALELAEREETAETGKESPQDAGSPIDSRKRKHHLAKLKNSLGLVLNGLRRFDEAISQFKEALDYAPDLAEAHNNLGVALQALGRHDEAIAAYRNAIVQSANHAEAYYNLALLLAAQGEHDEALHAARHNLKLRPNHPQGLQLLGLIHAQRLEHAAATACFRQAQALAPQMVTLFLPLALSLIQQGDLEGASEALRSGISLAPHDLNLRLKQGFVLLKLGRAQPAMAQFRAILEKQPDHAQALNGLKNASQMLEDNPPEDGEQKG